jgi:hypothetical protein
MKVKVFIKDTDVLQDAVEEAVDEELKNSGLAEDEQEAVRELRVEKALDVAGEWWEYGEYITVEFDTEARTARVVPVDEK